jgi:hypothetical protein
MHAYLIDPVARAVTVIEVEAKSDDAMLASLYEHMQCTDVEGVFPLNAEADMLYVNEYGKYGPKGFFYCRLWPHDTLTGRAVWIGRDGKGGHRAPAMSLDYVAAHIAWNDGPDFTHLAPGLFIVHGKGGAQ